jgi:hypothetical protein
VRPLGSTIYGKDELLKKPKLLTKHFLNEEKIPAKRYSRKLEYRVLHITATGENTHPGVRFKNEAQSEVIDSDDKNHNTCSVSKTLLMTHFEDTLFFCFIKGHFEI